jgi:hypothetical protein
VLLRSRWPWRPFGALLLVPPFSWIGAGLYRLIAANRHRLPGGTPACAVPQAQERAALKPSSSPEPEVALEDLLGPGTPGGDSALS